MQKYTVFNYYFADIEKVHCDVLRYLRQREVVHFQRFGEALRDVQDKMAEKKFYMNNMKWNCDCGCENRE